MHAMIKQGVGVECEDCDGEGFCVPCDEVMDELAYESEMVAMDMYDNYHARRPASTFARCECGRPDTKADILRGWKR